MTRRMWLALAVALAGLAEGCHHHSCCHRRPLFARLKYHHRPVVPAPVACCHGGEAGLPATIAPPVVLAPLPGPPPLAK